MCFLTKGKVNPLIGAAGISAYPMAARVVQTEGRKYDPNNWLLMHAMGANTGGQVGSHHGRRHHALGAEGEWAWAEGFGGRIARPKVPRLFR